MRPKRFKPRLIKSRQKCYFCENKVLPDYKQPGILMSYLTERGKIMSHERTGICAKHQRFLTTAIKRARHLATVPFTTSVKP